MVVCHDGCNVVVGSISHAMLGAMQGKPGMIFTIEFFRTK
jgi:hypothetical protein